MAYRLSALVTLVLCVPVLGVVSGTMAQSLTTEATVTTGVSTDDVIVAATQVRAFGEYRGWRFYSDTSFAVRGESKSDAFGAAYPYAPKASLLELKVEKTYVQGQRLLGIRMGRYRTPFGIHSGSDQGYVGFLRAPLIRNSYYWALSNNYLETGASILAGTTWLSAEASAGVANDQDELYRPGGVNTVVRVQGSGGPLIVGASYIRTRPSKNQRFASGFAKFTGVDFRLMKSGVQLRGEWINGKPFDVAKTRGGYADLIVHKVPMGPVTAVARIERIDYFAGRFSKFPRYYTLGARIRVTSALMAQVNYIKRSGTQSRDSRRASLDVGLSYTLRAESLFGRQGH